MMIGSLFMKENILQKFLLTLTLSVVCLGGVFFSASTSAKSCQEAIGGSCPVVMNVTSNGGLATINWGINRGSQYFSALDRSSTWGLYMINDWTDTSSGYWFSGGNYTPILTVTRSDLALQSDATGRPDECTDYLYLCTHEKMAARFIYKYGAAGVATVTLPSSWPDHRPPCMIFGALGGAGNFATVFVPEGNIMPCHPGHPTVVEPVPDPEWCGMSTSALNFEFGDMAPASVSGQSLSKTAVMACSKAGISYNLYLSNVSTTGRNRVDMGRGVTATVSANNQALQTNRVSTGATNSLTITVTLSGTPTSTGAISGTGILAVNYF
ncbi:hypothetical protein NGI12_16210 [Raoultella terrigena]|uniref:hypothetical protein n=1 Tax=Raoultella terrigena TaxID=577 RepID=UPI002DB80C04|nr:hypothetical protein [Raoultella terrigena]MEB8194995.1 hypothetical protein [Raoultella terrigena]